LDINYKLRHIKEEFKQKRDVDLINQIRKKILWWANKTLLLKGRITTYELGSNLFMGEDLLQFHFRTIYITKMYKFYYMYREIQRLFYKDFG